jgi:nitrogenase-stabilizing/protective protein
MTGLLDILKSFETAEDFLDHFGVAYEQRVVDVNRLHILQRLHDRLDAAEIESLDDVRLHQTVSGCLVCAYREFVESDARTAKLFKVFHRADRAAQAAGRTMIPLADVRGVAPPENS